MKTTGMGFFSRESRPILWLVFFFIVFMGLLVFPQYAEEEEAAANHYILLIDRSASTVSTKTREGEYKSALMEKLPRELYSLGFGGAIPQMNPARDIVSLLHFGVVPQGGLAPYRQLEKYNIRKSLLHPIMIHAENVSQMRLQRSIWPEDFFQMTLLTWVKPMALYTLKREKLEKNVGRTFLILVHDGELNESVVAEERFMALRWMNPAFRENVRQIEKEIQAQYLLSNGAGEADMLGSIRFGDKNNPIFCEVYEIVSRSWQEILVRLPDFHVFETCEMRWVRETGDAPQGVAGITLNQRFLDYIKNYDVSATFRFSQDRYTVDIPSHLHKRMELPVSLNRFLTCTSLPYSLELYLTVEMYDDLLGKSRRSFRYKYNGVAPLPFKCTARYFLGLSGKVVLVCLVLLTGGVFWWFRFYTTHIKIVFSGLWLPIPVRRRKTNTGHTPIQPSSMAGAFTLRFPSRLVQLLFYRGAMIRLIAGDRQWLYWVDNNEQKSTIHFPTRSKTITVWWNDIPDEPLNLPLEFVQGKQTTRIVLSFPKGIKGGEK